MVACCTNYRPFLKNIQLACLSHYWQDFLYNTKLFWYASKFLGTGQKANWKGNQSQGEIKPTASVTLVRRSNHCVTGTPVWDSGFLFSCPSACYQATSISPFSWAHYTLNIIKNCIKPFLPKCAPQWDKTIHSSYAFFFNFITSPLPKYQLQVHK